MLEVDGQPVQPYSARAAPRRVRLLGTIPLTAGQFAWAVLPALALLALWELGKLVVRRRSASLVP